MKRPMACMPHDVRIVFMGAIVKRSQKAQNCSPHQINLLYTLNDGPTNPSIQQPQSLLSVSFGDPFSSTTNHVGNVGTIAP